MELRKKLMTNKKFSPFLTLSLAVLLVISIGFIVWQNFIHEEPRVESVVTSSSAQQKPRQLPAEQETTVSMLQYGSGVAVSMQSDLAKLTNAPASFKSYLNGLLEPATTSSTDDGCTFEITVKSIYKQQFAVGGTHSTGPGCGSGFATLWGDVDGSWKKIAGSQESAFGCDNLVKYKVPSKIAGQTCINDSSPEGRPYIQE